MSSCACTATHRRHRIVLTGGPGAGKTAVLELVRRSFCKHLDVLPEAASILFNGGFRRMPSVFGRQATQRAIFHVQRELETIAMHEGNAAIVVCDRGTVDGLAYWPGPQDFWSALGTTQAAEFGRYDLVLHLRTPTLDHGYNHENPMRVESAEEAAAIDERIALAWEGHPRRVFIDSSSDFMSKANRAIEVIRAEFPKCCLATTASALSVVGVGRATHPASAA